MLESGISESGVFEGLLVFGSGVAELCILLLVSCVSELERSVVSKWRQDVEDTFKDNTVRISNLKRLVRESRT